MNIDLKIKKELETESEEIDEILNEKQGLFGLVLGSYKSGLGRWVFVVNIVILLVTVLMIWSGYEFFVTDSLDMRVYWGFCFVLTAMAQIALKQWVWMEMSRSSLLREIKRLEVAISRLTAKDQGEAN